MEASNDRHDRRIPVTRFSARSVHGTVPEHHSALQIGANILWREYGIKGERGVAETCGARMTLRRYRAARGCMANQGRRRPRHTERDFLKVNQPFTPHRLTLHAASAEPVDGCSEHPSKPATRNRLSRRNSLADATRLHRSGYAWGFWRLSSMLIRAALASRAWSLGAFGIARDRSRDTEQV